MSGSEIAQALLSLMFVLALIALIALLARRYGFGTATSTIGTKNKRVIVVEVTTLDARRRLVLVKRDNTEHLLLLGPTSEVVVEANISPSTPDFASTLATVKSGLEKTDKLQ